MRAMWRMSGIEGLIFIAVVAIAVACCRWRERLKKTCTPPGPTSLPLRRDGHTKVYCGDQKRLCDRTHV